jgi:Holliday junction DNA helicase RuvA
MSGNALMLQKVKGIGTKTAERIIVELKDKLQKFGMLESQLLLVESNKTKEESLSALEVLGIPKRNSEKLADRFLKQNPDISVEELVKQILKSI